MNNLEQFQGTNSAAGAGKAASCFQLSTNSILPGLIIQICVVVKF